MDVVSAACISAVIRHVCTCVFVRTSPSVWFSSATLAEHLGKRVCARVRVQCASLEYQLGFSRCVCARVCVLFVRRVGESSSRILLLQSKTHCFDWSDKLARSPQSAFSPPVSTLSLSPILTPSPPPLFPPSLR